MNKKKMALLFVILAACMWGTLGVTVKILTGFGFSPVQMVVARLSISAILLGLFLLLTDKEKLYIKFKDIKWFFATGILSMLFFNTSYSAAVSLTSLSIAAVLLYTSPIFVTLFSVPVFKEKLTGRKVTAMLFSVFGCALVSGILTSSTSDLSVKGLVLGICAAVGYAFYGILARLLVKKYHPLTILFYTFLFAAGGGLFVGDVKGIMEIVTEKNAVLPVLILIAFLCSVLPYILYTNALKYVEASKVAVTASIEPVVATILGVLFYKERVTISGIMGIVCVLFAIGLLNRE